MKRLLTYVILAAGLSADPLPGLDDLRKIPNLEKRAELALAYADESINTARKAYDDQEDQLYKSALDDVAAAVELSYKSLQDTGKAARRSPKHFKRAELKMRALMRRLDGLKQAVGFADRPGVEAVVQRVREVHEQILIDIMTKK